MRETGCLYGNLQPILGPVNIDENRAREQKEEGLEEER